MGGSRRRKSRRGMSDDELRRYIKFLIIPFIAIIIIIVITVSNAFSKDKETDLTTVVENSSDDGTLEMTSIEPDTKEYTHVFEESPLKKDSIPEVNQLMEAYFQAESDCDVDKFNSLFTSGDTSLSEELKVSFEKQKEYIEGYSNISCYMIQGPYDNYYIAYTYYETKYLLAETPGPGLIHPYVVKGEDGSWKIYDGEMTEELTGFQEETELLEDVRLLAAEVDRKLQTSMEEDPELKKIIEFVRGGPTYMEEESSPSGEN